MSAISSSSAPVVETRVPARKWWLAQRAPGPVDGFRLVAGAALFVHFGGHLSGSVPFLAWSGIYDPRFLGPGWWVRVSWLASGLSPTELQLFFASAMLLALAVAVGVAPRASAAALFCMSVATYWAIFPVADLSDYLASVTTLFLTLMPVGRACTLFDASRLSSARTVPGSAVTMFLVQIAFVYLSGGLGAFSSTEGDRYAQAATRAIPIAFILPVPGLRFLGVTLQLCAHGYWIAKSHLIFANVILAASGILFWGEVEDDAHSRPWVMDGGAVVGALYALTVLVAEGDSLVGVPAAPAVHVLADLGLLPRRIEPLPETGDSLSVVVKDTGERVGACSMDGLRQRRLAAYFGPNHDAGPMRLSVSSAIAERHCREKGYWGQVGSLVWSDEAGDHPIVEFECGSGGSLAQLR